MAFSKISFSLVVSGFNFWGRSGKTYLAPGKIRRSEVSTSLCLIASIILPSWFTKITFDLLPISSHTNLISAISPISLVAEKTKIATRSSSGCLISTSLAAERCLRSSIQNIGGTAGFSYLFSVNCTRENPDFIFIKRRFTKPFLRSKSTSSSREGW